MLVSIKILSKSFTGENSKKTYLELCKWLAVNVIAKQATNVETNLSKSYDIQYSVSKSYKEGLPTFKLDLYCVLDEEKQKDRMCAICQETHSLFYMQCEYQCNTCKMLPYRKKVEEELKVKRDYIRGRLNKEEL